VWNGEKMRGMLREIDYYTIESHRNRISTSLLGLRSLFLKFLKESTVVHGLYPYRIFTYV
jgi:hypothetical protein